jgi:hypothetical protein
MTAGGQSGLRMWLLPGFAWMCLCFIPGIARAQENQLAVRAAYLFNLTKYVSWPEERRELTICSAADERTGAVLKHLLEGKDSDGRTIRVVLQSSEFVTRQCSILYLHGASPARAEALLEQVGNARVLTVGDDMGFVHRGGMVGLVRTGDQMQLLVNLPALQSAGIRMSSRLLDIAVIVEIRRRN